MPKAQELSVLIGLGWSFRRIARETGVDRAPVSRYAKLVRSNPAKVFPGSEALETSEMPLIGEAGGSNAAKVFPGSHGPPRSAAAGYRDAIVEKLEQGLTVQRGFQDLQEEYGYAHSYESVKRYVRKLVRRRRVGGGVHTMAGAGAQGDFLPGAPTLHERIR